MIAAILATGPSMSQQVADSVKDRFTVVAVSDAYRLAPWADALVSQDKAWWKCHPQALDFPGRKFSGGEVHDVERVTPDGLITTGTNSGLLAMHVAVKYLGARTLLLLGFDMGGTHFFGSHPAPLRNTSPDRFRAFHRQFEHYKPKGISIFNCTSGSALKAYPAGRIEDFIESTVGPT